MTNTTKHTNSKGNIFRQLVHDCGLSLNGAARLLSVSYDSVRSWNVERRNVPNGVIAQLMDYRKAADRIFSNKD